MKNGKSEGVTLKDSLTLAPGFLPHFKPLSSVLITSMYLYLTQNRLRSSSIQGIQEVSLYRSAMHVAPTCPRWEMLAPHSIPLILGLCIEAFACCADRNSSYPRPFC